jgi:hypothetical protein
MNAKRARASKPWDHRAEELHEAVPQLSKAWTRWYAKREYLTENHDSWGPQAGFQAVRYFIAYTIQGQFKDDYAKAVERLITKVPSRHAQDVNAVLSTLEAVLITDGIYEGVKYTGNQDMADASLWLTATFTAANVAWNVYRLANRDGKNRPAIGYGSMVMHTAGFIKEHSPAIIDDYRWRAKREGVHILYAGLETVLENAAKSVQDLGSLFKRKP